MLPCSLSQPANAHRICINPPRSSCSTETSQPDAQIESLATTDETKEELWCIHDFSCGDNNVGLYRGLQGQEYYWLEVCEEAAKLQ